MYDINYDNVQDDNEAEIRRLHKLGHKEAEIIRLLNLSRGKVRYTIQKLVKEVEQRTPVEKVKCKGEMETPYPSLNVEQKLGKLLRSRPYQVGELTALLGLKSNIEAYKLLNEMEDRGYLIQKGVKGFFIPSKLSPHTLHTGVKHNPHLIQTQQTRFSFGVVSDVHLNSVHQQLTHLNTMYDIFAERGITDVFNPGDTTEGNGRIYRGQVYEMFNHGADAQRDYLISHYPKRQGITTHLIAGNHDYSFVESDGHDIIKSFAKQRSDIHYLGVYQADIIYNGVNIRLQHGAGSGKGTDVLERYINAYSKNENFIPNVLLLGHYHTANYTYYNGCHAVTAGGWHADSHYLKRLGLKSESMGWIFHVTICKNTGNILSLTPELICFGENYLHDY